MGNILGALFAILVGIASIPTFISYQNQSTENVVTAATAKQAAMFNAAATSYIQQNATTLQATATATTPVVIPVSALQTANLLPGSFSTTNPYGQTWTLEVLQPTAGNLQALAMTTGGTALSDRLASKIATMISASGGSGGFIPKNDSGTYPTGFAYGAYSSFKVATTNYTGVTNGALATLLYFNNGALTDNRLYRNSVPGQPQLNQMNTPLVMASQQTVGSSCATFGNGAIAVDSTGKLLNCIANLWQLAGGSSVTWKGTIATYAALTALPSSGNSTGDTYRVGDRGNQAYMWDGSTWQGLAVDSSGSIAITGNATVSGTANLAGLTNLGGATATAASATNGIMVNITAVEGSACPNGAADNGKIAKDATGLILSCQSGRWRNTAGLAGAKAWVNFAGNACSPYCVLRASFNIASVLQLGTGQYRISFLTPLPDSNYVVGQGLITNTGGGTLLSMTNGGYYAASGFDFWAIHNDNLSLDNPSVVSIIVFGN